jgi:hypothetical protein
MGQVVIYKDSNPVIKIEAESMEWLLDCLNLLGKAAKDNFLNGLTFTGRNGNRYQLKRIKAGEAKQFGSPHAKWAIESFTGSTLTIRHLYKKRTMAMSAFRRFVGELF